MFSFCMIIIGEINREGGINEEDFNFITALKKFGYSPFRDNAS